MLGCIHSEMELLIAHYTVDELATQFALLRLQWFVSAERAKFKTLLTLLTLCNGVALFVAKN